MKTLLLALALCASAQAQSSVMLLMGSSGGRVSTPTDSPGAGTYTSTQTVTLSDTTSGSTILYTTNGSTPACPSTGTTYSTGISVAATTTIKAIGCKSGTADSSVLTSVYTISAPPYTGAGDVVTGAYAWAGLRSYSSASRGTKVARVCNASDTNCADINSLSSDGSFDLATAQASPLSCADDACTVKTMYDQSGASSCGGPCDLTQATIASRPTLKFNCGASLPCLHFTGTQILESGNMGPYSVPFTYAAVAERTSVSSTVFFGTYYARFYFTGSAGTIALINGAEFDGSATDNAMHSLLGIFNGASSVIVSDGTSSTGDAGATGQLGSDHISFGAAPFGSGLNLTGYIREGGIWQIGFSSGQRTSMNSNQHTFWGF